MDDQARMDALSDAETLLANFPTSDLQGAARNGMSADIDGIRRHNIYEADNFAYRAARFAFQAVPGLRG